MKREASETTEQSSSKRKQYMAWEGKLEEEDSLQHSKLNITELGRELQDEQNSNALVQMGREARETTR